MSVKAKLLLLLIVGIIGIEASTAFVVTAEEAHDSQKRVIIVSQDNNVEIDSILQKYDYTKIKKLKSLKGSEVIMLDQNELMRLESENGIRVYDDVVINAKMPNSSMKVTKPQEIPWGVLRINAEKAWNDTTGNGVKVAVIDSGISDHKDLNKNIVAEYNAIDTTRQATDGFGHGTHVAGIIAAIDNKFGVVGTAPDVSLFNVKVLDDYGTGHLSDLIEGIEWSIQQGIQIMNISLGIAGDEPLLRESILRAVDAGVMVVASAGNNYGENTEYPAAYDEVIAVSAINNNDQIADFSARGKIDFTAPGVNIRSTFLNNGYADLSGTSMAAPHITGMLALLHGDKQNDSDGNGVVSTIELLRALNRYVVDIGLSGNDEFFGKGVVQFSYNE